MQPIRRTYNPQSTHARQAALMGRRDVSRVTLSLRAADCEVLELTGEEAMMAWRDSVFVQDFTQAFEDSVPPSL